VERFIGRVKLPGGIRFAARFAGAAGALLAATLVLGGTFNSRAWAGTELPFPRPAAIEPNVEFWVDVFTSYTYRDFIIHDRDDVWKVYQVLHLPGAGEPSRQDVDAINDFLKTKYAETLNRLATGAQPANDEERHIAAMFKGEPLSAYAEAAQNLRVQQGLRERFMMGLLRSRYYRPTMERIFKAAGLPPELVTLAQVESGFHSRAKSGAGAVGIWQFTRGTGKEYLRITRYHDDRLNPEASTRAAAELLRHNYETLGSWPLAITAYNYGTGGTAQAADVYGGNYSQIFKSYNGPHFGFASKNYYAEFLAALQIHRYEEAYFPDLKYAEAPPPPPVNTRVAAKRTVHHSRTRAHSHHAQHSKHTVTSAQPEHHASRRRSRSAYAKASARHHHAHRISVVADQPANGHDS
jgi:soluble lytic murein transglycosylase-like protein